MNAEKYRFPPCSFNVVEFRNVKEDGRCKVKKAVVLTCAPWGQLFAVVPFSPTIDDIRRALYDLNRFVRSKLSVDLCTMDVFLVLEDGKAAITVKQRPEPTED